MKYCCSGVAGEPTVQVAEEAGEEILFELQRTLKIPVHYATTGKKLSYLDRLTARLTYAVRLWCERISELGLKTQRDCSPYEREIQRITGLSAAFVQQARDRALWMWRQYRASHKDWERELSHAKPGTKWYKKLLKREPAEPCTSPKSSLKKIPTRFDARTGTIEASDLKISPLVIRISTLKKGEKITVLLNPSKWSCASDRYLPSEPLSHRS